MLTSYFKSLAISKLLVLKIYLYNLNSFKQKANKNSVLLFHRKMEAARKAEKLISPKQSICT